VPVGRNTTFSGFFADVHTLLTIFVHTLCRLMKLNFGAYLPSMAGCEKYRVKIAAMNTSNAHNNEFVFFRPRPDGDIDPAGEAGWFLQREREERGISLDDASAAVKIHPYHLNAIELGDLTGLPGRSDAMNMIGAYAAYLGFDPDPLVGHFAKFLPKQPMPGHRRLANRKVKPRPAPLSSAKILQFPLMERLKSVANGAGGIVVSCLAVVMLFGAASWVFMPGSGVSGSAGPVVAQNNAGGRDTVPSIARIEEAPLPEVAASDNVASIDADKAANGLSGLEKLIAKNAVADPIETASVPTKKSGPIVTVGKAKVSAGGGRVYGTENKKARLVLTANSNVWVRIEDAKGNVVMTRTLMAGDSYRVPNRKGLVVIARDGGLLSYSIDGKGRGSLGRKGEILVGQPLDLGKLGNKRG
jgi:cytoskeleton protein RodZ